MPDYSKISRPGLIPVKIENQGNLITTQVNKINFVGAASASLGDFNDVTISIGTTPSASYALSASYSNFTLSSSYALTASYLDNYIPPFPYTGSALITGSLGVTGSFSTTDNVFLKGIINQTTPVSHVVTFDNTTGRLYITASSAFGGGGGGGSTPGGNFNTIQFNNAGVLDGSDNFKLVGGNTVYLTGSLLVTGSSLFIGPVTASSFTGSFTGSLFGTSSWAVSASQAISASYVDYNNIVEFSDLSRNTIASVKNVSGVTILKGTPCYVTASGTGGNLLGIIPADAGDPNLMPAGIIASQTLGPGAEGLGYIDGFINGVDTSAFNSGDEVFVAVGGGYTNIKPTGSALIQPLGYVEKVDPTNGSGLINGPGHFFEVPNITSGYTWVGNSNQVATPISTASLFVSSSISSSFASNSFLLNNTASSVFATTGSNVFKGDQVISGSFKSTGSFEVKSDSVDLYGSTNIILNSTNIVAPVLPFSVIPGGAILNTVLIDTNNGTLYVTSSLPGTGGGGGLPDRILTGSITASVADGSNPSNPNFFLLQSGSSEMLKFNTDRVMVLESRTDTPTAVTGAIFYSASGEFFFGI